VNLGPRGTNISGTKENMGKILRGECMRKSLLEKKGGDAGGRELQRLSQKKGNSGGSKKKRKEKKKKKIRCKNRKRKARERVRRGIDRRKREGSQGKITNQRSRKDKTYKKKKKKRGETIELKTQNLPKPTATRKWVTA